MKSKEACKLQLIRTAKDLSGADVYAIANTLKSLIKTMHKPNGLLTPYAKFVKISGNKI